jgi:hypothetical protein
VLPILGESLHIYLLSASRGGSKLISVEDVKRDVSNIGEIFPT